MLRYEWVWYTSRCAGFLNAVRPPKDEIIRVFSPFPPEIWLSSWSRELCPLFVFAPGCPPSGVPAGGLGRAFFCFFVSLPPPFPPPVRGCLFFRLPPGPPLCWGCVFPFFRGGVFSRRAPGVFAVPPFGRGGPPPPPPLFPPPPPSLPPPPFWLWPSLER